jgi:hypothetical protein
VAQTPSTEQKQFDLGSHPMVTVIIFAFTILPIQIVFTEHTPQVLLSQ